MMAMLVTKSSIRLHATPKAVITRFLQFNKTRVDNIVKRVEGLSDKQADMFYDEVLKDFAKRHRDIENTFKDHFERIDELFVENPLLFTGKKKLLLGALFTMEYSVMAAALFNPSIVIHPDQSDLQSGDVRFIMSLRATGEGHISSIVFQTGKINGNGDIILDNSPGYYTRLQRKAGLTYDKKDIEKYANRIPRFEKKILELLPPEFTELDIKAVLKSHSHDPAIIASAEQLEQMLDTNYELESLEHLPVNEKLLFPSAKAESMGMEDVRLVRFEDEAAITYYGTYTAYNGQQIRTQLIETADFKTFKIRSLYGAAISDKGMALFPEKINGKYVMISRQGGEVIQIMFSEDLYTWENFHCLMEPVYMWEFVQLGNCGSPVKTDKGWLLLTHGVGPLRTYVISAIVLDLHDPTKIIGRLDRPLIKADETEREGYVPNVVYTCGCMLHENLLIIPYAVSDSATGFITVALNDLLNEMNL